MSYLFQSDIYVASGDGFKSGNPFFGIWDCSRKLMVVQCRAVMIPLISGSGIRIAIWTKEPELEPIPQWNQLQGWNWLNPKLNLTIEGRDKIQGNVLQTIFIKL